MGQAQARHAGIGFSELSNGFATCTDPSGCRVLRPVGPGDIDAFFDRWMSVLPVPLTDADGQPATGELSMRQVESPAPSFSTHPPCPQLLRCAGGDNLDIGRPDRIEVHLRRPPRHGGRPTKTEQLQDRIATRDTIGVTVNADLQALEGQAIPQRRPGELRIETVITTE